MKAEHGPRDSGGMVDAIRAFPNQLSEGRVLASSVDPGFTVEDANAVIVTGMGGSAIAGDLLRALCLGSSSRPVHVARSYRLPGFVDQSTIVVASSYSGETEETLAALDDALDRGARIICIATGGELGQRAVEQGLPFYQLPGGLQPRAALGYSLATMLTIAETISLISIGAEAWEESLSNLDADAALFGSEHGNRAKELAVALDGTFPFIYTGSDLIEPVGTRWCCQFAENAKVLAHSNRFPEMNHNEIMGWERASDVHGRIGVVVLQDPLDHPRVRRRMALTRTLLNGRTGRWLEVESRGASELARMLSLVHLGDWVSLYLAFMGGVDPTPIRLINQLKAGL